MSNFKDWESDQELHPDEDGRVYIAGKCPHCGKGLKISMHHRGDCCNSGAQSDLLAACKAALVLCKHDAESNRIFEAIDILEAAIAKAEREA